MADYEACISSHAKASEEILAKLETTLRAAGAVDLVPLVSPDRVRASTMQSSYGVLNRP